jgi:uncharacterized membrane protein YraQ (UPF0718 family)
MIETVLNIITACWDILLESSMFILFGFFIAGLLKAFIPNDFIQKHLGNGKMSSVLKSSLFGVPIPLCSCGVIPAAAGLREQGASKGATASFLISTPETGVDSIAVTYALLDPVMTVIRPVAAFFTALITGIGVNLLDKTPPTPKPMAFAMAPTCKGKCACGTEEKEKKTIGMKLKEGMRFAFGDLLEDIGPWLLLGISLAGVITVYISPRFIEAYLGDGLFAMLVMIALSTPLYVCATASTPIAAALALKGLSPGAALVFLLAGPATNMATITVVSKLLGKKTMVIYLSAIVICSLVMGLLVNEIYGFLGLDITAWVQSQTHEHHGPVAVLAAVGLLFLILEPLVQRLVVKSTHKKGCSHC